MKTSHSKALGSFFALVLCLGLSFASNKISFNSREKIMSSGSSRVPASGIYEELRSGSLKLEHKLASRLALIQERGIASIGRPADALESLRFGLLEGKYALKMDGDKVSEIKFVDTPETEGRPTTITDRFAFLKKYGSLLDAVSKPSRVGIDIRGTKIIETYRIKSSNPETDVVVSFVLDDLDRLFAMHAEKTSALTIF